MDQMENEYAYLQRVCSQILVYRFIFTHGVAILRTQIVVECNN